MDQQTFLNLLTTQLQYQDPLEPQDASDFVAQLAQFTSLEELIDINAGMEALYVAMSSVNNATMVQILGTIVTATCNEFHFDGENSVDLTFNAASNANEATVSVMDEDGTVIYSEELGALAAGENTWTWDGKDNNGQLAEEGNYTYTVQATDAEGNTVSVDEWLVGLVDSMEYASGTPLPSINGVTFTLSDIIELETAAEAEADSSESDDATDTTDESEES
jgi:flagellar basal-body rod modification protein FlgD